VGKPRSGHILTVGRSTTAWGRAGAAWEATAGHRRHRHCCVATSGGRTPFLGDGEVLSGRGLAGGMQDKVAVDSLLAAPWMKGDAEVGRRRTWMEGDHDIAGISGQLDSLGGGTVGVDDIRGCEIRCPCAGGGTSGAMGVEGHRERVGDWEDSGGRGGS
jgi:hypothetical protein